MEEEEVDFQLENVKRTHVSILIIRQRIFKSILDQPDIHIFTLQPLQQMIAT